MEDDKPFDFRDKIALELLGAIISNSKDNNSTSQDLLNYIQYGNGQDQESKENRQYAEKRFERLIRSCYRVADIMRRVRISAFE